MTVDANISDPCCSLVGVPGIVFDGWRQHGATKDRPGVNMLGWPEVTPGGRPTDGILELRKLCGKHDRNCQKGVEVHSLNARWSGDRSVIIPILLHVQSGKQPSEINITAKRRGDDVARAALGIFDHGVATLVQGEYPLI